MAPAGQSESLDEWKSTVCPQVTTSTQSRPLTCFQLDEVNALLEGDSSNEELLSVRAILEQQISEATSGVPDQIVEPSPPPPPPFEDGPSTSKWSKADHPAFQPDYQAAKHGTNDVKPVDIGVNDVVLAKWSGDGREYKAKVLSVTGSRSKPMYTVKWNVDASTETVSGADVKPIATDFKKRKADGPTAIPAVSNPPSHHPGVISAAATHNPAALREPRPEPSKCSDGPTRPAKKPKVLGSKKALEYNKSSWQTFQNKTRVGKKTSKGESMFRTGDGINARVGFTGSGKPMQKDQSRGRHTYDGGAEEEEQQGN